MKKGVHRGDRGTAFVAHLRNNYTVMNANEKVELSSELGTRVTARHELKYSTTSACRIFRVKLERIVQQEESGIAIID